MSDWNRIDDCVSAEVVTRAALIDGDYPFEPPPFLVFLDHGDGDATAIKVDTLGRVADIVRRLMRAPGLVRLSCGSDESGADLQDALMLHLSGDVAVH